jgi:hypothetical protein
LLRLENIIWEELLRLKKFKLGTFPSHRPEPVCPRVMAPREKAARFMPFAVPLVMVRREKESVRIRRLLVDEER